jgi:hypothetical protein
MAKQNKDEQADHRLGKRENDKTAIIQEENRKKVGTIMGKHEGV